MVTETGVASDEVKGIHVLADCTEFEIGCMIDEIGVFALQICSGIPNSALIISNPLSGAMSRS